MLMPPSRGGRGGASCCGDVKNGGLWWPRKASKVAVYAVVVASPCRCRVTKVRKGRMWLVTELRRETRWWSSAALVEERAA